MAGKRELADNIVILILTSVLGQGGTLVMGMILVRLLSQGDYGSYLQLNLIYLTVAYLMIFGLPATVYYYLPRLRAELAKTFVLQTVIVLGVFAAATCAGLYLFHDRVFGSMNNPELGRYVFYLLAVIGLTMLLEVTEPLLITLRRPHVITYINVARIAANISLTSLALWLGYGLEGVMAVWTGLLAGQFLFLLGYLATLPGSFKGLFGEVTLRKQLGYAAPLGLGGMSGVLSGTVDKFLVSSLFAPTHYAVYGRGAMSPPLLGLVVSNVANVILPGMVGLVKEGQVAECLHLWHIAVKKVALIILPSFVFFLFFAGSLFVTLFTQRYLDSVPVFRIFLLGVPLQITIFGTLHRAFDNTRIIFWNNTLVLACNVVLGLGLYYLMGFYGIAVATITVAWLLAFLNLLVAKSYFKVSWGGVFPWGHLLKLLAICFAAMVPVYPLVAWAGLAAPFSLALGAALYGPLYLLCLFKLGLLTPQDQELILSWLNTARIKEKFRTAVS